MSNMNPNVIKKSFEEQVALISTMLDVHLDEEQGFKLYVAMSNTLDYINDLEDKSKEFEKDYDALENKLKASEAERKFEHQRTMYLQGEIEKLKGKHVIHIDISEQYKKECEYEIKTAKSEAIKEFAEKFNRVIDIHLERYSVTEFDEFMAICQVLRGLQNNIDNLVKEMESENNVYKKN